MSSSALFGAKKRTESVLRSFQLPTQDSPNDDEPNTPVLLLSLLQSRLNWANAIFPKYRPDNLQQPKKTSSTRKKWPNMRYLGSCTLELGPHLFPDTQFYEAVRRESWDTIATAANLAPQSVIPPSSTNDETATIEPPPELVYTDIVIEFKESPQDRFLFPKDIILELTSVQAPFELLASFLLPLDPSMAGDFFLDPLDKVKRFGHTSPLDHVRSAAAGVGEQASDVPLNAAVHQPVNIRMYGVGGDILKSLVATVTAPEIVRQKLMAVMTSVPDRFYLCFSAPESDQSLEDMAQRILTVPDITTGPVLAEKKRSELNNAIALGKRPRSDQHEEGSKSKAAHKEEQSTMKRCAYCSTRHTAMWRAGPAGSGTLCNGCGILWEQGKILKGAPVVSKDEERSQARERRLREHIQARLQEQEREREEQEKREAALFRDTVTSVESPSKDLSFSSLTNRPVSILGTIPLLQRSPTAPLSVPGSIHALATSSSSSMSGSPPASHGLDGANKTSAMSLYNATGIPLPTLSIDFGDVSFSHPHCTVTLTDRCFSIRLLKEGSETAMIEIDKQQLQGALFELQCESPLGRELLIMTCTPRMPNKIERFDTTLIPSAAEAPDHTISIRFLEKLDPSGGAVVKRIVERWLSTTL